MVNSLLADSGDPGDVGLIPGSGSFPGGGNGNSLQYSCLENRIRQKSLLGYSPSGRKISEVTEYSHRCLSSSCILYLLFLLQRDSSIE